MQSLFFDSFTNNESECDFSDTDEDCDVERQYNGDGSEIVDSQFTANVSTTFVFPLGWISCIVKVYH